jgi:hypothetical protein
MNNTLKITYPKMVEILKQYGMEANETTIQMAAQKFSNFSKPKNLI